MLSTIPEVRDFASKCLATAEHVADSIQLKAAASIQASLNTKYGKRFEDELPEMPRFFGWKAWAVILSVDLRKSSVRAVDVGPRGTYMSMHTYLPTMAELVNSNAGMVIGLRGDGLFAGFGVTKWDDVRKKYPIEEDEITESVRSASKCGKAMIESTDEVLEPLFNEKKISSKLAGPLQIGVGIDLGEIVITNIGIEEASERTAYGPAVNNACKLTAGNSEIRMTKQARDVYPKSENGRMRFRLFQNYHRIEHPPDYRVLPKH